MYVGGKTKKSDLAELQAMAEAAQEEMVPPEEMVEDLCRDRMNHPEDGYKGKSI